MLPLHFWISTLAALPPASAQAPRIPSATLFFNLSVPLASLPKRGGTIQQWWSSYANTQDKGNDTIAQGPARLVSKDVWPTLSVTAAATAIYVYGDLGTSDRGREPQLQIFSGDEIANNVASKSGLIGMANMEMFKYSDGYYQPIDLSFKADKPTVDEIIVTTGIETDATSLEEVNVTTWRFVEDGRLNPRFTWHNSTTDGEWNTTSSYAAALNDGTLRTLAEQSEAAVSVNGEYTSTCRVVVHTPANASWVGLNVTRGPTFSDLRIKVEPEIEGYATQIPSTRDDHYSPDEMVWFRSLDPLRLYNISISSFKGLYYDGPVALNSITFYGGHAVEGEKGNSAGITSAGTPSTGSTGSQSGAGGAGAGNTGSRSGAGDTKEGKTNVGAIAGGVVGGVLGALVLAGLAYFFLRRRRQNQEEKDRQPRLEIDDAPVTPYTGQASTPGQELDEKGLFTPVSEPHAHSQEAQQPSAPPLRAVDGGAAPGQNENVLEPPEYNPQWQRGGGPESRQIDGLQPAPGTPMEGSLTAAPGPVAKGHSSR